jgi:hypothetical protein
VTDLHNDDGRPATHRVANYRTLQRVMMDEFLNLNPPR